MLQLISCHMIISDLHSELLILQVVTASADGSIRRWQTVEQGCLNTIRRQEPIMGMVLVGKNLAVVSTSWRNGEAGRLWRCNLETEDWQPILRLNTPGTTLAMSPSRDFVATFERNTVHCIKPHHPDVLKFRMHHTRNITVRFSHYTAALLFLLTMPLACGARLVNTERGLSHNLL